jgi:hypothetical protein
MLGIQKVGREWVDLSIEEDLVRNLPINSRSWTLCGNIGSSGHCISPEGLWKLGLFKHRVGKGGQGLVHSFCQAILLWHIQWLKKLSGCLDVFH